MVKIIVGELEYDLDDVIGGDIKKLLMSLTNGESELPNSLVTKCILYKLPIAVGKTFVFNVFPEFLFSENKISYSETVCGVSTAFGLDRFSIDPGINLRKTVFIPRKIMITSSNVVSVYCAFATEQNNNKIAIFSIRC